MRQDWQLVGREEELRFVERALAEGGVALAGPAGVGKTRLAREAVAAAQRHGLLIYWLAGSMSAREIPLGAFAGVVDVIETAPMRVVREVVDALIGNRPRRGVVIAVDDAHLLDQLSAHVVHQLAMQELATVVITVRTGEPAPEAVTALWKDGHVQRLDVEPLSEDETGTLMAHVLDGPVDDDSAHRMWAMTLGNVLFMRHLVDEEIASRRIVQERGVWRWQVGPIISSGLTELVDARLATVSDAVGEVLDYLAVAEPLDPFLLGKLADTRAVEEAESAGLLSVERDGRRIKIRSAHPLYAEVRRGRLGRVRARRLRGRVATVLASTGMRRAEDPLRWAVLVADSDLEPDPEIFTAAARTTFRFLDFALAQRLATKAIEAGAGFDAEIIRALALSSSGDADGAEAALAAMQGDDDKQRTTIALSRAGNLRWIGASDGAAQKLLEAASTQVTDPTCLLAFDAYRASFAAVDGRPGEAVRIASAVLAAPRISDLARMQASWGLVLGLGLLGRPGDADATARSGYALAERSFEASFQLFGLGVFHLSTLRLAGMLDDASAVPELMRPAFDTQEMGRFASALFRGIAEFANGALPAARRDLEYARSGFLAFFPTATWTAHCLVNLTTVLAQSGATAQAADAMREFDDHCAPALPYLEPETMIARAWLLAAQGITSEASAQAAAAAERAAQLGQPAHEVLALQAAARLGSATGADRLAALAPDMQGPRAGVAAAYVRALAHGDAEELVAASNAYEQFGDRLSAMDAAAQASLVFARGGKRGSAVTASARASQLARDCGGATTPALREAIRPAPLSPREREIATLAARGLSNREIAERLVVSVRTVEGHMYRITAKLGGVDRARLGDILDP